MKKLVFIFSVLFLSVDSFCQNFENRDVTIAAYWEDNGYFYKLPRIIFTFSKEGFINSITNSTLIPVRDTSGSPDNYIAKYYYNDAGRVNFENLYKLRKNGTTLVRHTEYSEIVDSCQSVIIYEIPNKEKIGEFKECYDENKKVRYVYTDRTLIKSKTVYEGYIFEWVFDDEDRIKEISLTSGDTISFYKNFKYFSNEIITESKLKMNTNRYKSDDVYYGQYLFNNRGQITNVVLPYNDKKDQWHTKIIYDKTGLIKKMRIPGRNSRGKVRYWRNIHFKINCSKSTLSYLKENRDIVNEINNQIIDLKYDKGEYASTYLDSRRNVQF